MKKDLVGFLSFIAPSRVVKYAYQMLIHPQVKKLRPRELALMGTIGIFLILALVMFFSRKIDWYNIRLGEKSVPPSPFSTEVVKPSGE
ncbi:MAG: inner membrane CreD family protein [Flavobacteriales bacterium]|nr:inner membrane CreD family protein [Flavobacteriales bacterium]